jgi:predicted short-subunit dehydrogenase-like oxidoreductase (DUF2520 family)
LNNPLNIVIIGTGNVANHFANAFRTIENFHLTQVFNHQNSRKAQLFAKQFQCDLITDYAAINSTADLYIIAVKDDAINQVVVNLIPLHLKGIVVHTSGSMAIEVLEKAASSVGVLYPLQSFYKGAIIDWKSTPILIEGNTPNVQRKLKQLASYISKKVQVIDSKNRLQIHLSAVFACNFTNAMYVAAYELIEKNISKKNTHLLQPIMLHSFEKLQNIHPKKAQTGPAMRKDQLVMKKHLHLLKEDQQLTKVYKTLSELILKQQYSV